MKNNTLRTLARTNEMQTLYARAKDMGLRFFNNDGDHSRVQVIFLSYLELYFSLYKEIASSAECISLNTLKDDMDVDAYLVWRRYTQNKKEKSGSPNKKSKSNNSGIPTVRFKKKRK